MLYAERVVTTVETLERRVIELEVKLTYQDRTVAELNEVVIELRAALARLQAKTKRFEEQLAAGLPDAPENGPPPHY